MVISYHYLQEFQGTGFLMSAQGIAVNLQRIQVFQGSWSWLKNIFSGLFVYGFSAVNVFLILSGFVLTWGVLESSKPARENWADFFFKKSKRILIPLYISMIAGGLLLTFRNSFFPALNWWPNYGIFDLLKFLFPPFVLFDVHWLQQMDGDYWYIPLILQLYLIFPVLIWLLRKKGWKVFLLSTFLLTVGYRFLATFGFEYLSLKWNFLDTSPMGVISNAGNSYYGFSFFLPRLFEFSLGMVLAYWQSTKGNILEWLTGKSKLLLFAVLTMAGFCLNYYRVGWIFSDPVIGIGLFGFLLNLSALLKKYLTNILKFISDCSFEIYLLHHYFLNFVLIPTLTSLGLKNETGFWLFWPFYFLTVIGIGKLGQLASLMTGKLLSAKAPVKELASETSVIKK
jgi:peptidoglycan/LPS O-acetylase OafA/YrhL